MALSFVELRSEAELLEAWPVMSELRDGIGEATYLDRLAIARKRGYRLFALRRDDVIAALAGVEVLTTLASGRHLYVWDLVTTAAERSRGHGKRTIEHLVTLARDEACERIMLDSATWRVDAHRFYEERAGFEKVGYTFRRDIAGEVST